MKIENIQSTVNIQWQLYTGTVNINANDSLLYCCIWKRWKQIFVSFSSKGGGVTKPLSPCHYHYTTITIPLSANHYYHTNITKPLPPHHYHQTSITILISQNHTTITTPLLPHHYHPTIITTLLPYHYHHTTITKPISPHHYQQTTNSTPL